MRDPVLPRWTTNTGYMSSTGYMRPLMTDSSQRTDRSQQEAMAARIESLERRVAQLEDLERKREQEWEAARERWLHVAAAEIDGRWAG
jgi:hypothetical protein